MKELLKNIRAHVLIAALIYVALGIVLLVWPGAVTDMICYLLGAAFMLYGVVSVILYLTGRRSAFAAELISGVLAAAVGLFFLLRPTVVISIIPIIMGIVVVIDGLTNLRRALELRRLEYRHWLIPLVLSLLSITMGIAVIFQPYLAGQGLVMLLGALFLYEGLSDLWAAIQLIRMTRLMKKRVPIEVDPIDIE